MKTNYIKKGKREELKGISTLAPRSYSNFNWSKKWKRHRENIRGRMRIY
jgi:hypothetical protein